MRKKVFHFSVFLLYHVHNRRLSGRFLFIFCSDRLNRVKRIIFFAFLFFVGYLFYAKPAIAQVSPCASVGGTCRTSCNTNEQAVTGQCAGQRVFCCAPRTIITPVQCQGACRAACLTGEVQFRNVNNCDVSGQLCCSTNPLNTQVCDVVGDLNQRTACVKCFEPPGGGAAGAWTAIGCIPTDPSLFIETLLRFAIGIAGGIAFLLILFGGFQMMTSAGNPERLNGGKELVSSAVTGLLLIIFSIFLLKVIGVDILGIPGFR